MFYAISNIWCTQKTWIFFSNSFSFHFAFYAIFNIKKTKFGNIEKCPFTYLLIGNFTMKLNGRWFPQIVDRDSGNLYPIYIYIQNCGVSFWTCWREISGDRVALLYFNYDCIVILSHLPIYEEVFNKFLVVILHVHVYSCLNVTKHLLVHW